MGQISEKASNVIWAAYRFVKNRRVESYQKERYVQYRMHLRQAAAHLEQAAKLQKELGMTKDKESSTQ